MSMSGYVVRCAACHPGCLGSCSGPDSIHCASCREGYEHVEDEGCQGEFLHCLSFLVYVGSMILIFSQPY